MTVLIDPDEMIYELTHWKDKDGWYHDNREDVYHISEIKEVCNRLPEAVVRCRDCENWGRNEMCNGAAPCEQWSDIEDWRFKYTEGDDFCSYGERRTDGNS